MGKSKKSLEEPEGRAGAGPSRRDVLASALGSLPFLSTIGLWPGTSFAEAPLGGDMAERMKKAYQLRAEAAERLRKAPLPKHRDNGDARDPALAFSKSLPHDALGRVDAKAFKFLDKALLSGDPDDFEKVPLGGKVKLANPQAALTFDLVGPDAASPEVAPPPRLASPEQAAEMVELYWQALLRDVPFADYEENAMVRKAADELSRYEAFSGPRRDGKVVPGLLFRGPTVGERTGPYLSQFLLKDLVIPPIRIPQKIRTCQPGDDYLADYGQWLEIQNGGIAGVNKFDSEARFLRNGRDLAEYVHRDIAFQGPFAAGLMLLKWGVLPDGGNPYKHSRTQSAFTTFGPPCLLYLVAIACQVALSACWYQKWMVHRRIRPEEVGGLVENHRLGKRAAPLDPSVLGSEAMQETVRKQGNALLSSCYPEGCPIHPAYPSGHAVIGGAGVTVLKAFFDEKAVVPDPVLPNREGLALEPFKSEMLTIGGELDKLASNLATGRNFAGIHWRTDLDSGLQLGEEVAIEVLRQFAGTGNELFNGFSLRRFNGTRATL